jgi:hypothetical protein
VVKLRLILLLSAIGALTGCAGIGDGSRPPLSMTTTTLMSGWEHHFTVEFAADQGRNGTRRVSGYINNNKGEFAIDLRVLARAVDASGAVIGQRIAFVPGGVGGFGRVYFEVAGLPAANAYQVSVWDYTWAQGVGDWL